MTVSKTPRKRAPVRDVSSGKFEQTDPLADPNLMAFALRTVRAISDLEPVFAMLASVPHDPDDNDVCTLYAVVGMVLAQLKTSMLETLVADPDSLSEAKKKRLDAARLGNMPLSEVEAIRAKVQAWLALPDFAAKVLKAKTEVIGGQP